MGKLACRDYGFECDFIAKGEDVSHIIESFQKHTLENHGIEYSKESLEFTLKQ
jgi:predicted small metal-binding protein